MGMMMEAPHILIFRDLPEERRMSMDRYADSLQAHLPAFVAPLRVGAAPLPTAYPGRLGTTYRRFGAYPLHAARQPAAIGHILDHGYADLGRWRDRRRTVITVHDLVLLRPELCHLPGFPERARRRFLLLGVPMLRRAGRLIAVSESTRRDLAALLGVPTERVSTVPMGVDPHFRPLPAADLAAARRRLDLPGGPLLLHIGHTGFYKNIEGLLRCFAALADRPDRPWLLRVGPALSPAQQALARSLGIAERIIERHAIAEADLPAIYGLAAALCFPSHYEGFGWPPLEAMACGTLVATSSVASLPELVGAAALCAPPAAWAEHATNLARLLDDAALRATLRARGFQCAARFTWERTALATAAVYMQMLDETITTRSALTGRRP